VQAVLFRFLTLDLDTSLGTGDVDSVLASSTLAEAKALLKKYELMERLSLLELAVWKSVCMRRVGDNVKTVEDAISIATRIAHRDSWRKYQTEMRKSNTMGIVIKHVLPFLDAP
jgi:hypothetical protein